MAAITVRMSPVSDEECYNAFFTFEYKGKVFAVWQETFYSMNDFSWCPLKWNIWSGTHTTYDNCSEDVDTIVNIIINQSRKSEKKFELKGEHYIAQKRNRGYVISRSGKCRYFNVVHKAVPIVSRFLVGLIFAALYTLFYINISGISLARSAFPSLDRSTLVSVLWYSEMIGVAVIMLIKKFCCGLEDICINTLIPLNVFTLIGALRSNQTVMWITVVLAVVTTVMYVVPAIYDFIREKRSGRKMGKFLDLLTSLLIPAGVCIFACMIFSSWFGVSGVACRSDERYDGDEARVYEQYCKACELISREKWGTLSEQERINVLQWISDYECVFILGCNTAIVQSGYPKSDCILGEYNHVQGTLTISKEYLMNSGTEEVLDTILHETRHIWQHTVSEMYNEIEGKLSNEYKRLAFFRTAESLRDNCDFYSSGTDDYNEYYYQALEEDSRGWASYEIKRYEDYIYPKLIKHDWE